MKLYEYKGKHYCEEDISLQDDLYDGDLYDLYWELKKDNICAEETIYHLEGDYDKVWNEAEEMVEECFDDLVIDDVEKEVKE